MMRQQYVFLACVSLLLCLLTLKVTAQHCKHFYNETELGYNLCSRYIDYKYYLSAGPTAWTIEAILYYQANRATAPLTLAPEQCERKLVPYVCGSIFPECDVANGEAVKRPMCRSVCEEVISACGEDYFISNGQTPPNCTALPTSSVTVTLSTEETAEIQCFELNTDLPTAKFPFECGGPFNYNPNAEPFPCSVSCPAPFYSDDFVNALVWVDRVVVPPVFLLGAIILCIQLYKYQVWMKWPRIWIFFDGVFLMTLNLGHLVVTGAGGFVGLGCVNDAQSVQGDSAVGIVQHWLTYIGTWGSSVSFAVISTNVLLVTIRPVWLKKVTPYISITHGILVLAPPVIILIVMQSLGYNGYCSGLGSCYFMNNLPLGEIRYAPNFLLSIIPFTTAQVWGFLCISIVIILVAKTGGVKGVLKQARLVAFLICYGSIFAISLIGPYQVEIRGDAPANYISCLAGNWIVSLFSSNAPQQYCDLESGRPINPFSTFFQAAIINWLSLLFWVLFFGMETIRSMRRTKKTSVMSITGVAKKTSNGTHTTHSNSRSTDTVSE